MANITLTGNAYIVARNVAVTFAEIAANSEGSINLTVNEAEVGMVPVVALRTALDAGLVQKQAPYISALNTVTLVFANITAAPITGTTTTADIVVL